ncbi:MAG: GGDEF domain-containing protein [Gammaproteobacteria bacterium]
MLAAAGALAGAFFLSAPPESGGGAAFAGLLAALLLFAGLVAAMLVYVREKLLLPVRRFAADIQDIRNGKPVEDRAFHDDEIGFLMRQVYDMKKHMDRNYQDLEEISFTDSLTGLYNRHYFFQAARHQIQIAARNRQPASVLIGDIDHFKSVNDKYGHLVGDAALKHAAEIIRGSIRESDICARFGGEEFIVLFINSNIENSILTGEKIRANFEESPCESGGITLRLTISSGVSPVDCEDENGINDAIKRADKALYEAKNGGRNRVCSAD